MDSDGSYRSGSGQIALLKRVSLTAPYHPEQSEGSFRRYTKKILRFAQDDMVFNEHLLTTRLSIAIEVEWLTIAI